MTPVGKALWFIEAHFARDISLDELAKVSGASRFHLSRAFGLVTGSSIQRYLRGRRLSEAARELARGAVDILTVALNSGYGSHEAFTRAFREQFDITPESLRSRGRLDDVQLVSALRLPQDFLQLAPPRIAAGPALLLAGANERYTYETCAAIPGQWQAFVPHIGSIARRRQGTTYGVLHNIDDAGSIDYLCGVEVADFTELPARFARLRLASQTYAVFEHRGHIAEIHSLWHSIWNGWFPASTHVPDDAPMFERYDASFDPRTGAGGFEIWVPLKPAGVAR